MPFTPGTDVNVYNLTVFIRSADTDFTIPSNRTEWDALTGSFTEVGDCFEKSVKLTCKEGNKIKLSSGIEVVQSYEGNFQARVSQYTPENITELESMESSGNVDVLLYDKEEEGTAWIVKNVVLKVEDEVTTNENAGIPIAAVKRVGSKSSFREVFAIPEET